MEQIYSSKEEALIDLNTSYIRTGDIKVYRYYSNRGVQESFVIIGLSDGIGPGNYHILSKSRNLIVSVTPELPDITKLILGQTYACPVEGGIYALVYLENHDRVVKEIQPGESYYVEDMDSGYLYYLDRTTCKRLDDFFSKTYISFSNTGALWDDTNKPETEVSIYKDSYDITEECDISINSYGCMAAYDNARTIRVNSMDPGVSTASVKVTVVYRESVYTETWNISRVSNGKSGEDSETYKIISRISMIRPRDLDRTVFEVSRSIGSYTDTILPSELGNKGLVLSIEYSNGQTLEVTEDTEYVFRLDSEITHCIVSLKTTDGVTLDQITLPVLPDTTELTSGQGVYKSSVYQRSNTKPSTPKGGSWSSPVPTGTSWSDKPTADNGEPLWVSTRTFTTDGEDPQQTKWSEPVNISNSQVLEIRYSSYSEASVIGTPSTNPEYWSDTISDTVYYMASRTVVNGVAGDWKIFSVHGKDGAKSDYQSYIYYRSESTPTTPVGQSPIGWVDGPDSIGTWWMSVATIDGETGDLKTTWSVPVKITGSDGEQGQTGPYYKYQYATTSSPLDPPVIGWSEVIPSVTRGLYLWQRMGLVTPPETAPGSWETPFRITGEKGEAGASGTNITIDLTNELTSVAATYEGEIVGTIEGTKVILYENSSELSLRDPRIESLTIVTSGVSATLNRETGDIAITGWTAPEGVEMATVTAVATVMGVAYSAVYTIQKIKAGAPGEDAILYSIIPSATTIKRSSGFTNPDVIECTVVKTTGGATEEVDILGNSNLALTYIINSQLPQVYRGEVHIPEDLEVLTFVLKTSSGTLLDRETIVAIESATSITIDLDNELSAVSAADDGSVPATAIFETSKVSVFYGDTPIAYSDLILSAEWINLTGTFDDTTGIITPTGWDPAKLSEDTGSVRITVTYGGYTKSVVYTIKKIMGGVSPTIYSILPDLSVVKSTSGHLTTTKMAVMVRKNTGGAVTNLIDTDLASEGLTVKYQRTKNGAEESVKTYTTSTKIPFEAGVESVTIILLKTEGNIVLDKETVPVVFDGPGQEFIYTRTSSIDDVPADVTQIPENQSDGFLPDEGTYGTWTLVPQGVEDARGKRVEWASFRKKTDGVWGKFQTPSIYAVIVGIDNVKTYLTEGHASITGTLFNHPEWHLDRDGTGWVGGSWNDTGEALGDADKNDASFGETITGDTTITGVSNQYINKVLSWDKAGNIYGPKTEVWEDVESWEDREPQKYMVNSWEFTKDGKLISYNGIECFDPSYYENYGGHYKKLSEIKPGKIRLDNLDDGNSRVTISYDEITFYEGTGSEYIKHSSLSESGLHVGTASYDGSGVSIETSKDKTVYLDDEGLRIKDGDKSVKVSVDSISVDGIETSTLSAQYMTLSGGNAMDEAKLSSDGISWNEPGDDYYAILSETLFQQDFEGSSVIIQEGNIQYTGSCTDVSDRRLKEDIVDLEDRGALRPVKFKKKGDDQEYIGFIAQEVQEIYPEVVKEGKTPDKYLSLNYPALTAALQAQINTLTKRIEALEEELKKKQ